MLMFKCLFFGILGLETLLQRTAPKRRRGSLSQSKGDNAFREGFRSTRSINDSVSIIDHVSRNKGLERILPTLTHLCVASSYDTNLVVLPR